MALNALVALERGRSERLKSELDGRGLVGRELAFAYRLAHGVLRRERLLDSVLSMFAHRGLPKDPTLRVGLRLGLYQLLFVAGMPAHAAVHETVGLLRRNQGFANAMLRNIARAIEQQPADPLRERSELPVSGNRSLPLPRPLPDDEIERLALLHSLPDWLARRFAAQHGSDGLRAIAEAASIEPGIYLRASTGIERAELAAELAAAQVEVEEENHPRLLRWCGGESPFVTEAFASGRFVVQDPTALRAVEAVPCAPGDRVVDLCAAPGTKTTWLAEQVRPGGRVFAHDPNASRRSKITDNVRRLGLEDVVEVVADAEELPVADCVLADVPCSNTGVLGRRVEVRRRLAATAFEELPVLQRELLDRAIGLTRPGGHTVYATCSIDRDENEAVVDTVLAAHPEVEQIEARLTLPLAANHDGGFFAVLRRARG